MFMIKTKAEIGLTEGRINKKNKIPKPTPVIVNINISVLLTC